MRGRQGFSAEPELGEPHAVPGSKLPGLQLLNGCVGLNPSAR